MKIYASLFEHMNDGFVWLKLPELETRRVVKITNSQTKAVIFCEALRLDGNFLTHYNFDGRAHIEKPETSIVMNEWYRKRLGNLETKNDYPLVIEVSDSWWDKIRACLQHPQNVVRIATRLGLIGVGLGVIGFVLGIVALSR
jgi:hypothetical protein